MRNIEAREAVRSAAKAVVRTVAAIGVGGVMLAESGIARAQESWISFGFPCADSRFRHPSYR